MDVYYLIPLVIILSIIQFFLYDDIVFSIIVIDNLSSLAFSCF